MLGIRGLRAISLSPEQSSDVISCGRHGVFVGDVPLLVNTLVGRGKGCWTARPFAELNSELTVRYRLPVDVATKAGSLSTIANALNRGDLALAAIAAVQMQFPDLPPPLKEIEPANELLRRAVELHRSGLLKADWDPTKHPRTGTKPNPGWFAPASEKPRVPDIKPGRVGWPLPHVNKAARKAVAEAAEIFVRTGRYLLLGLPVVDGIVAFMEFFSPTELNQGEDRLTAQLKAALQQPKTLRELQQEPTENGLGYEQHHIVGQNPDNLIKGVFHKFGVELLDGSTNLAWVPRLQHECISATYSSKADGQNGPTLREIINKLDFDEQRAEGLKIMRECGALK